jgi:hypothetical protein
MATFPAIRIEGGLLGPDVLDQLLAAELPGQKAADFGLDSKRNLTDEIAAVFADARALWQVFQHRLQRLPAEDLATSVTRDAWGIPFLGLLGYELHYNSRAFEVDGLSFAISHGAVFSGERETMRRTDHEKEISRAHGLTVSQSSDAPPVHIVGARQELGRVATSGRPRLAPHSLVQEYLNRTEHLWGIVTNGLTVRLLRDSTFVRRQAYVEFDLAAILEESRFQDFAALYRLLHRTRLPHGMIDAGDCLLETYYARSVEQGGRVREHLRDGVEECITTLANGFLRHPKNDDLRQRVLPTPHSPLVLSPDDLYRQLLRLVYRFLFLLVSEDRGLLSPDPIYREHYGIVRLQRLLENRAASTEDDDLWQSLRVLWKVLSNEKLAAFLKLAPLNGELFAPQGLDSFTITNRDLLDAFWHLAWYQENSGSPPRRVNYAALDVEELGSVYESLLEFHPHLSPPWNTPTFDLVLEGRERRSTGSHYTPPELVAPLIQHALEPVLEERIRVAATSEQKEHAILSLKVCDIACGSGHFLLAAARRLGKELARVRTGEDEPAPERVREAVRDVISHCIYGVDKNPLAVELCRVALWLESYAEGKPLTFLDHRIRCGDSLVGVFDLEVLEHGIPDDAFKPVASDDKAAAREAKKRNASERDAPLFHAPFGEQLKQIAGRLRALDDLPEDTIEQVHAKADAYLRIEHSSEFERLQLACDVWTAAFFQPYPNTPGGPLTTEALRAALVNSRLADARRAGFVLQTALERHFFHWPLAFPEVFAAGGFDVLLGNPPFMGGLKISTNFGDKYRQWVSTTFDPFPGTADLCAAFFRRAFQAINPSGRFGLIATNTLGQGDTRESGLAPMVQAGGSILFAQRFVKWPGQANVEVNQIAAAKGQANGSVRLDGHDVAFISSRLDAEPEADLQRLRQNEGKAFIGYYVRGIGFVLEPEEAKWLLAENPRNADCLFPYLNGEDLNSDPEQKPSRFVICFHDWPLEKAKEYSDLLSIVEERVKPERMKLPPTSSDYRKLRDRWWQFARLAVDTQKAIAPLRRVLVRSEVSQLHVVSFVPKGWVYSHMIVVFAFEDDYHFALLQSGMHEAWVWREASSLESRNRYTPSDCFDTFPFPQVPAEPARAEAERLGETYHEHRRQVMLSRQLGLTKTYNLFHNPQCADADIARLRELHAAMDHAILACYGWTDPSAGSGQALDPGHGFHANERGQTRYTISPKARREVLRRLLELNFQLAAASAG